MAVRTKRFAPALLALCLALALTGCRTRTGGGDISGAEASARQTDDALAGEVLSDTAATPGEAHASAEAEDSGAPAGRTVENPAASRREFDERASAEVVPGTDRLLHAQGEGTGTPLAADEVPQTADRLSPDAEKTAARTVPVDKAERMGVSEEADAADSARTYFTVLLQERTGSLFECKRVNVYWETAEDHVTVHKTGPEHTLILNAGAYDVSARLLPDNLRVDDGWVARKNPQVIVKIVDSGVLGSGVGGTGAAQAIARRLRNREGWASVDAVQDGKVLLLSEELLEAPHLQLAAMLFIAKTAYPEAFADTDPEEALRMLAEEATGLIPAGTYAYRDGKD